MAEQVLLQGGIRLTIDKVPLEEALIRYTGLIVQGLKDTGAEANPLRKQFKTWAVIYRKQAQDSYDIAASGGWKRLSPVTIALKQKQRKRLGAFASKAPVTDALRATDVVRRVLNPQFTGQLGAVEIQRVNGVELGYGGGGVHPTIKKKDIKALQKRTNIKKSPKINIGTRQTNPNSVIGGVKSKSGSAKNKKKRKARAKGPITVAEIARIHNKGLGLPKRSIDDHVYLEANQETAASMGALTLDAVTELAKQAGFGTEEVFNTFGG